MKKNKEETLDLAALSDAIMNFKRPYCGPTLSRIVDVTKEKSYRDEKPIVTPFVPVFLVGGYEYILMKEDGRNYTKSFATEAEAESAAMEFLGTFRYDAVIVNKEGRFDKLFRSVTAAEQYVTEQPLEWVSGNVTRKMRFGLNVYGGAYGGAEWERYHIEFVCFEDR